MRTPIRPTIRRSSVPAPRPARSATSAEPTLGSRHVARVLSGDGHWTEPHRRVHRLRRVVRVGDDCDRLDAVGTAVGDGMMDERRRDPAVTIRLLDEEVLDLSDTLPTFPRREEGARLAVGEGEPVAK